VKKSETSAAYYEVIEHEADVVRMVFAMYTQQGLSINAIAHSLNQQRIPTRTKNTRWERSTIWGMLRNPAYQGKACYGKTELRPRQRITRPLRQRNRLPNRNSANHERPREEWIEVMVPALVSEQLFALAQEQLEKNKQFSPRRTKKADLAPGILVCQQCGYALYRASGGKPTGQSTITDVLAQMGTAGSTARCVPIVLCGRIISMQWSGSRSLVCWRMTG